MSSTTSETSLQRSNSMGSLDVMGAPCLDPSCVDGPNCPHRDSSTIRYEILLNNLNKSHRKVLDLKLKNQKLRGILKQQHNVLNLIKDDTKECYRSVIMDCLEQSFKILNEAEPSYEDAAYPEESSNYQARSLLAAIEAKRPPADVDMKDALTKLAKKFDEDQDRTNASKDPNMLLKQMLKVPTPGTTNREVCFADNYDDPNSSSSPLEWWTNEAFRDIKPPIHKPIIPDKMERSTTILPNFVMPLIPEEPSSLTPPLDQVSPCKAIEDHYANEAKVFPNPSQPANLEVSLSDKIKHTAVINKKMSAADYNASFEKALSHCDLALLMGACRAVDPTDVFTPCSLSQAVLLSLVQQLATDMLHETQLKCRYLEEALINLDASDPLTQVHLPLVVGEVRKHLSTFVRAYPHHVANRRVSLIIMAASNLIK